MAEGSLVVEIQGLQTAFNVLLAIMGTPPTDDSPGTGLLGAAASAEDSPQLAIGSLASAITGQLTGLLAFDGSILTQASALYDQLPTDLMPTAAFGTFAGRLETANIALSGDFVGQLQAAIAAIESISTAVPENRGDVLRALVDQLLAVFARLDGPYGEAIAGWARSVQDLSQRLLPIILEAQAAPDPITVLLPHLAIVLADVLRLFGFGRLEELFRYLDNFATEIITPAVTTPAITALDAAQQAYLDVQGLANAAYPEFRDATVVAIRALQAVRREVRAVAKAMQQIAAAPIFQPHALENFLREQIDQALDVEVEDVRIIDDPYKALLDEIDAAIDGIDLDFVRDDVLGFFDATRQRIQAVDIASIGTALRQQVEPLAAVVNDLQAGVSGLQDDVEGYFNSLGGELGALAEQVGTFKADGTFEYNFESNLRNLFGQGQKAIAGDPANPGAPSVAGTLQEFRATIDNFIQQFNDLLAPLGATVDGGVTTAVDGVANFATFLDSLEVPTLMAQLSDKIDSILDQLLVIDFDQIIDPVIAEIEENGTKLAEIDPSSLNDMLREALKVALDVVINIDFTVEISAPLATAFDEIRAVPQTALDELQQRYEQVMAMLDELSPEMLLEALFSAFDVITEALDKLNVEVLLQPLDELHAEYIKQPVAVLAPSTLLAPVSAAFQQATAGLAMVSGSDLIAPLAASLDQVKTEIAAFDITAWIDDILAAVEKVKTDIAAIRPSELLQPLADQFARLEAELDRFAPAVVFAPLADLAEPLLDLLENIQQEAINALHDLFRAPFEFIDRLHPEELTRFIQAQIDVVLNALRSLNIPGRIGQLRSLFVSINGSVQLNGDSMRIELAGYLDPDPVLGDFLTVYNALIGILEGIKNIVELPDILALYDKVYERLFDLLPPFARELMDPEKFKRVMRLADPTRFLTELDARFQAVKAKLIPISPEDLGAALDATFAEVLALVDGLAIDDTLNEVKNALNGVKNIAQSINIDFIAVAIEAALADFQAMINALDPAQRFAALDTLHLSLLQVVDDTKPSVLLADLQTTIDAIKAIVNPIDPRTRIGPPLEAAWASIEAILDAIDFTVILAPLVEKLDELRLSLEASLHRTEEAFDAMLGSARTVLSGGVSVSAGISV